MMEPKNDVSAGRLAKSAKRYGKSSPDSAAKPDAEHADDQEATPSPQPSAEEIRDALADNLRSVTGAAYLYVAVASSLTDKLGTDAFQAYRDKLVQDAGSPSDPIETMLLEQLALAHFNVGRLQIKSCSVESPKLAIAYADAATRLLGEFRRCTLALEDFRAKQAARKERSSSIGDAGKPTLVEHNEMPRPSVNGEKKALNTKLTTTNEEVPECIRQRMGCSTPSELQPAAAIGRNGKA